MRPERVVGPLPISPDDIDRVNRVFSEAFTDRYQRDGMTGIRVPPLNPAIWRFAIESAGEGAMAWRDADELIGFNLVHHCGTEGWMGPLAVRPASQGRGIGGLIVESGIRWLQDRGARVIGLETMPRTVDNIGFYSRLGFRPGHLTVSLTRDLDVLPPADPGASLLSTESRRAGVAACRALTEALLPGTDFSKEIGLTLEHRLGDVTLLRDRVGGTGDSGLAGFALWHSAPLANGKSPNEIRVLKLAARDLRGFARLVQSVEASGWASGHRRVGIRCQTAYRPAYGALLELGYRVHWTDLRMTLGSGPEESARGGGVVFSNWEI